MMEFVDGEEAKVEPIAKEEAGRRVREAREAAGYRSARAAALAIGMDPRYYSAIEAGRTTPVWTNLLAIAAALGLDPAVLFPELLGDRDARPRKEPPTVATVRLPLPPGVTPERAARKLAELFAEEDGK
jgi:transcriptional regulator with XRE-family HTH domain